MSNAKLFVVVVTVVAVFQFSEKPWRTLTIGTTIGAVIWYYRNKEEFHNKLNELSESEKDREQRKRIQRYQERSKKAVNDWQKKKAVLNPTKTAKLSPGEFENGAVYHLIYEDADGNITDRYFTFVRFEKASGNQAIRGFCHTRNEQRVFYVSRMQSLVCTESGEVLI